MVLIGIGGPGCQSCLFHTANLFESRGTALNVITAFIGPSFVIFEVLAFLCRSYGLSLEQAFLYYSGVPFAFMIVSFLIMVDEPYSGIVALEESQPCDASFVNNLAAFEQHMASSEVAEASLHNDHQGKSNTRVISLGAARPIAFIRRKKVDHRHLRSGSMDLLNEPLIEDGCVSIRERFPAYHSSLMSSKVDLSGFPDNKDFALLDSEEDLIGASLWDQLFSSTFAELTLFFAMTSLFYNLFLGSMQDIAKATLLESSSKSAAVATSYVSTYLTLSPMSGLLNPLIGYCIDTYGFHPILTLVLTAGVMHALALHLNSFFVGAGAFSLYSVGFFSYMYSYLAFKFGFDYYGLLAGIIQFVGSITTLTMQPYLRTVAATDGWPCVERIQLVSLGLLWLLLITRRVTRKLRMWCRRRRQTCDATLISSPRSPLSNMRSYSDGDVHQAPVDQPCRRRSELFPNTDDILLIDGALAEHSCAAYQLSSPPRVPCA
eukprot:TRINITY_DN13621_c0_g3_i1.p1 TRINITY_DN13621_c0_g3~~TRINITY_DN13621_c0_g3_i1.p1  ORF type:complete len:553 (+),score=25.72 TRINITY_DN13621_c0_g3_i1:191-1660(+)